jgi:hypothetical protein
MKKLPSFYYRLRVFSLQYYSLENLKYSSFLCMPYQHYSSMISSFFKCLNTFKTLNKHFQSNLCETALNFRFIYTNMHIYNILQLLHSYLIWQFLSELGIIQYFQIFLFILSFHCFTVIIKSISATNKIGHNLGLRET